jgi:hypothetical protein
VPAEVLDNQRAQLDVIVDEQDRGCGHLVVTSLHRNPVRRQPRRADLYKT